MEAPVVRPTRMLLRRAHTLPEQVYAVDGVFVGVGVLVTPGGGVLVGVGVGVGVGVTVGVGVGVGVAAGIRVGVAVGVGVGVDVGAWDGRTRTVKLPVAPLA